MENINREIEDTTGFTVYLGGVEKEVSRWIQKEFQKEIKREIQQEERNY